MDRILTVESEETAPSVEPFAGDSVPETSPSVSETGIHKQIELLAEPSITSLDGFDPAIHAVDENGQPKRKPDGTYAMKRGRKPGGKNAERVALPKDNGIVAALPNPAKAAAIESAAIFVYGGVAVFGDEWNPKSQPELVGLEAAFERYYIAKGITEFPPTIGLLLALAAYSAPRLAQSNTQTKLQKIGVWAKEKFSQGAKFIGGK